MITIYHDKGCRGLIELQDFELDESYSCLWFQMHKSENTGKILEFIIPAFSSFQGFFWLASPGGYGSSKMLDIKRAFGGWGVPKRDVCVRSELYDVVGEKIYSDIAKVGRDNIETMSGLFRRHLFGVDSNILFLPVNTDPSLLQAIYNNTLGALLIKRNMAKQIDKSLQNFKYVEKYIDEVVALGGVATVVVRDSSMGVNILAVGNRFTINQLDQYVNKNCLPEVNYEYLNDSDFYDYLKVGVWVSSLC